MKYKTSPKYCYYIYDGDILIAKGRMDQVLEYVEESEWSIRNAYRKNRLTQFGHRVERTEIDYYAQKYDIVDSEDKIIFTGNTLEAQKHFDYKSLNLERLYKEHKLLKGMYRIFKHGEHIKPYVSKETETIADMLAIHDNTIAGGKHIERTLEELKKLGIHVDVEASVIFKGDFILKKREEITC